MLILSLVLGHLTVLMTQEELVLLFPLCLVYWDHLCCPILQHPQGNHIQEKVDCLSDRSLNSVYKLKKNKLVGSHAIRLLIPLLSTSLAENCSDF